MEWILLGIVALLCFRGLLDSASILLVRLQAYKNRRATPKRRHT